MAYGKPIPLLDFQPDSDDRTPGVLVDTDGMMPTLRGLKAQLSFTDLTPLPDDQVTRGITVAQLISGFQIIIAGTETSLYQLQEGVVTLVGSGYLATPRWRFATFGNDILAANGYDELQVSRNGMNFKPVSAMPGYTTSSLGGQSPPPNPAIVEVCDYGVFLIPPHSNRWFFSPTDVTWKLNIATLTVTGFLTATPGPITAFRSMRGGLVVAYKARGVYVGSFTGPPFVWSFQAISEQLGCTHQESVINVGDYHLFLGQDNFYQFDGSSISPIPNALKTWFFSRVDVEGLASVLGRFDQPNDLAVWHYKSIDAPDDGLLDEWVAFHVRTGKWTRGTGRVLVGDDGVADVSPTTFSVGVEMTYDEMENKFLIAEHTPHELGDGYDGLSALPTRASPTYDQMFDAHFANDQPLPFGNSDIAGITTGAGMFTAQYGPATMSYLLSGEIGDGINYQQLTGVRPIFAVWPYDGWSFLQGYIRAVNGYPIPDPVGHQGGEGAHTWLNPRGDYNLIQTARAHQIRADFDAAVEITAVAVDMTFAGAE